MTDEPNGDLKRTGRPDTARFRKEIRDEPVRDEMRETSGRLKRNRSRTDDKFHIDPRIIPSEMSYEWKRSTCYGQPDGTHLLNLRDNHWSPVPVSRHPELMPDGSSGAIQRDGMILMERPAYLTKEARQEDFELAVAPVEGIHAQMSQTPGGTMTRNHPSVKRTSGVKRTYEPFIPE